MSFANHRRYSHRSLVGMLPHQKFQLDIWSLIDLDPRIPNRGLKCPPPPKHPLWCTSAIHARRRFFIIRLIVCIRPAPHGKYGHEHTEHQCDYTFPITSRKLAVGGHTVGLTDACETRHLIIVSCISLQIVGAPMRSDHQGAARPPFKKSPSSSSLSVSARTSRSAPL